MDARLKKIIFIAALLLSASSAHAGKFDVYFGGFDFSAKTGSSSGSKSGLGAYKVSYQLPLMNHFEAGIGYTLILSNTVGGDAAFGFDIDASYFPFTETGKLRIQTEKTTVSYDSLWKPFVSVGYHARQFQSVSTQYNGFSIAAGTERVLDARFNAKGMLRYGKLAGPSKGEATEITALFGITFGF